MTCKVKLRTSVKNEQTWVSPNSLKFAIKFVSSGGQLCQLCPVICNTARRKVIWTKTIIQKNPTHQKNTAEIPAVQTRGTNSKPHCGLWLLTTWPVWLDFCRWLTPFTALNNINICCCVISRCSVLACSAYVALGLGDNVMALVHAQRLLSQSNLVGALKWVQIISSMSYEATSNNLWCFLSQFLNIKLSFWHFCWLQVPWSSVCCWSSDQTESLTWGHYAPVNREY